MLLDAAAAMLLLAAPLIHYACYAADMPIHAITPMPRRCHERDTRRHIALRFSPRRFAVYRHALMLTRYLF